MGNSLDKVLPGLYVGGIRASAKESILNDNGITHILSIHDKAAPIHKGRQYLCIRAHDNASQDLAQYFPECNDFIHQARLNGGRVLVHCFAGMSRSVTVTAAYIMTVTSLPWRDALNSIRGARRCANPNFGFQKQLIAFYHDNIETEKTRFVTKFPKKLTFDDKEECQRLIAIHREYVLYGDEGRPKSAEDDPDLYPIAHDAYKVKAARPASCMGDLGGPSRSSDQDDEDPDENYIDMSKSSFKRPVSMVETDHSENSLQKNGSRDKNRSVDRTETSIETEKIQASSEESMMRADTESFNTNTAEDQKELSHQNETISSRITSSNDDRTDEQLPGNKGGILRSDEKPMKADEEGRRDDRTMVYRSDSASDDSKVADRVQRSKLCIGSGENREQSDGGQGFCKKLSSDDLQKSVQYDQNETVPGETKGDRTAADKGQEIKTCSSNFENNEATDIETGSNGNKNAEGHKAMGTGTCAGVDITSEEEQKTEEALDELFQGCAKKQRECTKNLSNSSEEDVNSFGEIPQNEGLFQGELAGDIFGLCTPSSSRVKTDKKLVDEMFNAFS